MGERDYSAAQIMAAISAALKAQDMPAVAALMRMLAVKDPTSAQMILDVIELTKPADRTDPTVTAAGGEGAGDE